MKRLEDPKDDHHFIPEEEFKMQNDFRVETLVEVLSEYCFMPVENVTSVFQQAVVVCQKTGKKSIELTIVEEKMGLPSGFFAKCLETEKTPVAPTTEALIKGETQN